MNTGSAFETLSQRTLAAIVFTDVVSYSARMNEDEEHTLLLVQRDLQLISNLCEKHKGQVLKFTGDGLLMHFQSAVQAVACAQEAQQTIAQKAVGQQEKDVLFHRIGIHLGDVFLSKTDVMGDGVNIAARLQSEAQPGGICMSRTVYDVVKRCLTLRATDLGPRELKNIKEAVHVYQILLAAIEDTDGGTPVRLETERVEAKISPGLVEKSAAVESAPAPVPAAATPAVTSPTAVAVPTVELPSVPTTAASATPASTTATTEIYQQLKTDLTAIIGPMGTFVFNQATKDTQTPLDAVERMMLSIPSSSQDSFYSKAIALIGDLDSTSTAKPNIAASPTTASPTAIPTAPAPASTTPEPSSQTVATPPPAAVPQLSLSDSQKETITQFLSEDLGPMASVTLKRAIAASNSSTELIQNIQQWLPGDRQTAFQEFAAPLLAESASLPAESKVPASSTEPTPSQSVAASPTPTPAVPKSAPLEPAFLEFCQSELSKYIGPIAGIALKQSQSANGREAFISKLMTFVTDPQAAAQFKQALDAWQ